MVISPRRTPDPDGVVAIDLVAAGVRGRRRGVGVGDVPWILDGHHVPLEWKRSIALSVYLYVRSGELRALQWEDVDFAHSVADIHRSQDREGTEKTTKTGNVRQVPIEPTLLPLLAAMRAEVDGRGPVIELPDDRHLSRGLRSLLTKAKITRSRLLADDATRKNLTWYDLRATGITWLAIRGDDPLKIMARAGHTGFATTQGYIRSAEPMRADFGQVFPTLPNELSGRVVSLRFRSEGSQVPGSIVEAPGIEPGSARLPDHLRSRA